MHNMKKVSLIDKVLLKGVTKGANFAPVLEYMESVATMTCSKMTVADFLFLVWCQAIYQYFADLISDRTLIFIISLSLCHVSLAAIKCDFSIRFEDNLKYLFSRTNISMG